MRSSTRREQIVDCLETGECISSLFVSIILLDRRISSIEVDMHGKLEYEAISKISERVKTY